MDRQIKHVGTSHETEHGLRAGTGSLHMVSFVIRDDTSIFNEGAIPRFNQAFYLKLIFGIYTVINAGQ